ncbi:hypothetical protein MMC16_006472 [Acarospora aff. strigata]|nr:hypothetical protein [Acarospora aff. strigata]
MEVTPLLSPTKARIQLAQAHSWAYINTWLASKCHPSTPSPFERNEETLNALLALSALNDSADEERELFARVEHVALKELGAIARPDPDTEVLSMIEDSLTVEGRTSLDALASLSVALGGASTEGGMANNIVQLKTAEIDMQQKMQRVEALQSGLARELSLLKEQLAEVRGEELQAPADILQRTSECIRSSKLLNAKLVEYREKVASLERVKAPDLSIPQIVEEEKMVLKLQERVRSLEIQVSSFRGLPPDWDLSKTEVARMREELVSLESRRDSMFEELV